MLATKYRMKDFRLGIVLPGLVVLAVHLLGSRQLESSAAHVQHTQKMESANE